MTISRRSVLLGGATVLGAALLAEATVGSSAAAGSIFDVRSTRHRFARLVLPGSKTQQSFCFNIADPDELFVAEPYGPQANGDLLLLRYRMLAHGPEAAGRMRLVGFGHGESLGAYSYGGETFVWVEADSLARERHGVMKGFGTGFASVRFVAGRSVRSRNSEPGVHVFRQGDYQSIAPSIDPGTGAADARLFLRFQETEAAGGGRGMLSFDLSAIDPRNPDSLPVGTPHWSAPPPPSFNLPQGWAVQGNYLYTLEGHAQRAYRDTYVRVFDIDQNKQVDQAHVTFAQDWRYHEPEGITIRATNPPQLHFCISSKTSARRRPSHLYYVDALKTVAG